MHTSTCRFALFLLAPSLLWSHVFVLYVRCRRWQCPMLRTHAPKGSLVARGLRGGWCPQVCLSGPALQGLRLVSPHRVVRPCARVPVSCSFGLVVNMCAGALGRRGTLVRRCPGQCGPVVLLTLLPLAYSFLDTVSRWIVFRKVMPVDVRPT